MIPRGIWPRYQAYIEIARSNIAAFGVVARPSAQTTQVVKLSSRDTSLH